jgi:hypothetical protein
MEPVALLRQPELLQQRPERPLAQVVGANHRAGAGREHWVGVLANAKTQAVLSLTVGRI